MAITQRLPILYSFRRCPYAMRARLAIASASIACELREILLRDKAEELLAVSPKATVPVLVTPDGRVISESLDIMHWALQQNDPENLSARNDDESKQFSALIGENDGPFKRALDRYKYGSRDADGDGVNARQDALQTLMDLDHRLKDRLWLFGETPRLADLALLPFIRQFAHVDRDWFYSQDWHGLCRWLDAFKQSKRFAAVMNQYPRWRAGDPLTIFPS